MTNPLLCRRRAVLRFLALVSMVVAPALTRLTAAELTVKREGKTLIVTIPGELVAGGRALHVASDRNAPVVRFTDKSPREPAAWTKRGRELDAESWLPTIDVRVQPDMEAIVEIDGVVDGAQVSWNGWVRRECEPLRPRLRFPAERLLEWENTLWIDRKAPRVTRFYLRKPLPAAPRSGGAVTVEFTLLDADWGGRIELVAEEAAKVIGAVAVERPSFAGRVAKRPAGDGFAPRRLHDALAGAIAYTLESRVQDPRDPMHGGLYLFYDLDARTYRTSHWIWGWGPSAGLLIEARKLPPIAERFSEKALLDAAKGIGEAALRSVPTDPEHPAFGIPASRWDRSPRFEYGHEFAFTPCDAGFLAAWTWVPLAKATGERKWRDASERLAGAIGRLMNAFPIPPQNYWPDYGRWDEKVIDEAGFGVELYDALHRLTGDARHRELGRTYIEQHVKALGREDGLWDRVHFLDGRPNQPTIRMTRGMGWPMEGLIAAHRLLPEGGRYLELANRMAEHLLAAQKPEGWWVHRFDQPVETWGVGTKGTALWCWLFYELYRHSGDARHLAAARRALGWLLDEQYFGDDDHARGGHVVVSPHSAVGMRPWYRVACTYGAAFFGLAILEELKLQAANTP